MTRMIMTVTNIITITTIMRGAVRRQMKTA